MVAVRVPLVNCSRTIGSSYLILNPRDFESEQLESVKEVRVGQGSQSRSRKSRKSRQGARSVSRVVYI